jgi:hypothetical protein
VLRPARAGGCSKLHSFLSQGCSYLLHLAPFNQYGGRQLHSGSVLTNCGFSNGRNAVAPLGPPTKGAAGAPWALEKPRQDRQPDQSGGKGMMTVETYEIREQLRGALQLAGDYDSIWVSSHGGRSDTSKWFDVGGKNSTDVNAFKSELSVDVAQKIQFHHCDYVPNHSWVDGINNVRA